MKTKKEIKNLINKLEKIFQSHVSDRDSRANAMIATLSYDIKEAFKYILDVDNKIDVFIEAVLLTPGEIKK